MSRQTGAVENRAGNSFRTVSPKKKMDLRRNLLGMRFTCDLNTALARWSLLRVAPIHRVQNKRGPQLKQVGVWDLGLTNCDWTEVSNMPSTLLHVQAES